MICMTVYDGESKHQASLVWAVVVLIVLALAVVVGVVLLAVFWVYPTFGLAGLGVYGLIVLLFLYINKSGR